MKNNELNERRLQATPRGIGVMCGFYADRAENATLWDIEGNEVIDFAAGIAVLNTGHRHPKVIAAIEKQLQSFTHTAYQIVPYASYVTLAERINERVPVNGPAKTAFFSTGAEAVENTMKHGTMSTINNKKRKLIFLYWLSCLLLMEKRQPFTKGPQIRN